MVVIKLELGNCCVVHACACVCVCDKLSTRGSFVIRDSVASLNQSNLPCLYCGQFVCFCVCVCVCVHTSDRFHNIGVSIRGAWSDWGCVCVCECVCCVCVVYVC